MDDDAGSSHDLCVSCGICCDGALFDQGPIYPHEEEQARAFGFTIVQRDDGRRHFLLPCGNLCGSVCQIYEARPTTCRTYKCTTLQAAEAGEIDRAEADRRVTIGRATVAKVRQLLLPGESFHELRVRFGEDPAPTPGFRLVMVQWDMVMDRFFRKPHQRVLSPEPSPLEPIAPPAVSPEPCTVIPITPRGGELPPASPRLRSTG